MVPRKVLGRAPGREHWCPTGLGYLRLLRAQPVSADRERLRPRDAGPGQDPRPDRDKPIRARLDLVCRGVQGEAHELAEVATARRAVSLVPRPGVRCPGGPWARARGHSCSRAARRALMPRAVWLLTAPRLIPIAVAISAS